ncbi:MAG TPA: TlpA disulfide reductase family protein [Acidimicrobiales bacterium]|nr:TlpA disulfide reductase family protein [Acidimicrobiales bacterium]
MSRRFAASVAAACFALASCENGGGGDGGGDETAPEVGRVAPTFATTDLDGEKVRLRDFRGQTVVVNFWASWCTPCRKEFPLLAQLDKRDDVTVLGVVFKDTVANARRFMDEQNADWPALRDDGAIAKAYRVGPGIPASVVVGADGVVRVRHIGEFSDVSELLPPD